MDMDDVDLANEFAELHLQHALQAHFGSGKHLESAVKQYPGGAASIDSGGGASPGPRMCIGCGEEIPPARIAANPTAARCVDCQAKKERR
jgi:hypothetical protein